MNAAVNGLQNDGSPQAVGLLVGALETSTNPTVWSYITNEWGTGDSRSEGRPQQGPGGRQRRQAQPGDCRPADTQIRRSPGYPYCSAERDRSAQSERWDEAISRYASAIEIDPELAEAYSGRGHALLQKNRSAEPPSRRATATPRAQHNCRLWFETAHACLGFPRSSKARSPRSTGRNATSKANSETWKKRSMNCALSTGRSASAGSPNTIACARPIGPSKTA